MPGARATGSERGVAPEPAVAPACKGQRRGTGYPSELLLHMHSAEVLAVLVSPTHKEVHLPHNVLLHSGR